MASKKLLQDNEHFVELVTMFDALWLEVEAFMENYDMLNYKNTEGNITAGTAISQEDLNESPNTSHLTPDVMKDVVKTWEDVKVVIDTGNNRKNIKRARSGGSPAL